jgi:hypothetical protein
MAPSVFILFNSEVEAKAPLRMSGTVQTAKTARFRIGTRSASIATPKGLVVAGRRVPQRANTIHLAPQKTVLRPKLSGIVATAGMAPWQIGTLSAQIAVRRDEYYKAETI